MSGSADEEPMSVSQLRASLERVLAEKAEAEKKLQGCQARELPLREELDEFHAAIVGYQRDCSRLCDARRDLEKVASELRAACEERRQGCSRAEQEGSSLRQRLQALHERSEALEERRRALLLEERRRVCAAGVDTISAAAKSPSIHPGSRVPSAASRYRGPARASQSEATNAAPGPSSSGRPRQDISHSRSPSLSAKGVADEKERLLARRAELDHEVQELTMLQGHVRQLSASAGFASALQGVDCPPELPKQLEELVLLLFRGLNENSLAQQDQLAALETLRTKLTATTAQQQRTS
eukprot:gnl/TRDRNA2_/TRDRNA2_129860_c0_seq1.p1 gnl/TRDRNA2_/TRDRNA2_129860_c0~~gnl/TRDRNA2_/TRDRNA2_129860_c0_seq1.p1  ORF type:complete len:340 (+),score=59.82 gnl/TRDRNA2_/TRDRNA2_129860_c0_seq1:132-1022(+)